MHVHAFEFSSLINGIHVVGKGSWKEREVGKLKVGDSKMI